MMVTVPPGASGGMEIAFMGPAPAAPQIMMAQATPVPVVTAPPAPPVAKQPSFSGPPPAMRAPPPAISAPPPPAVAAPPPAPLIKKSSITW